LLDQIKLAGLPEPTTEFIFHFARKWRFDLYWDSPYRLAVEVDGGLYLKGGGGRHNRPRGYEEDCRKLNEAALLDLTVLRVTTGMVQSGEALALVERALHILGNSKYVPPSSWPVVTIKKRQKGRKGPKGLKGQKE
jgi:hypothetical protein